MAAATKSKANDSKGGDVAVAAKPGVATVSWKQISATVAEQHNVSKKQAQDILDGAIDALTGHLKQGDKVRIPGFGTFAVRKREARSGRNPATGETIQIAASKKVSLSPAKELKESI